MNKFIVTVVGSLAALSMAPAASAAVTIFTPGVTGFAVTGDITSGTVSAAIGHAGIVAGAFTDIFRFTIDQTGVGSGSLSTSTSSFQSLTDLDITSVFINGVEATKFAPNNLSEFFDINGVNVVSGVLNEIVVTGTSRGNGSYGGNATFTPTAVPEAATWAMMLIGFGAVGSTMRYRRRSTKVAFAA